MQKKPNLIATIVLLIGVYIGAQAIADVAATRMIQIEGIVLPGGALIFALTFTLRDLIHERLGKKWAQAVIVTAGLINVGQFMYLELIRRIPSPPFYFYRKEWGEIFAIVPAVSIASIIAELISELVDTEVYQFVMNKLPRAPRIFRVLISNFAALPIDSLLFALLGFVILPPLFGGEPYSISTAFALTIGQVAYKGAVALISSPLIYAVKTKKINIVMAD